MQISFLLGKSFPKLSETFILNQITGLLDSHHSVDIYADRPGTESKNHSDILKYDLFSRTHYRIKAPKNFFLRALKALYLTMIFFLKDINKFQIINIIIFSLKIKSFKLIYEIFPFLHNPSYDIIICHFGHNGIKCLNIKKYGVLRGKLITVFHGADITKSLKKEGRNKYNNLFNIGDLFLPISVRWRDKLIELGCDPKKIIVHHMGVDCDSFAFREREVNSESLIKIVTVCRLVEKKGVEYGIRAVAKAAKNNNNISYDIIGDGPLRPFLEKLIQDLEIGNHIKILGWQDKDFVIKALDKAHIMLAPSVTGSDGDQEGIPVALMEAMAMGIPVISTFHSGIPELIEDNVSGFLVEEKDIMGLENKIKKLLYNPDVYQKISLEARRKVEKEFNIKFLNIELEKIFSDLLEDT